MKAASSFLFIFVLVLLTISCSQRRDPIKNFVSPAQTNQVKPMPHATPQKSNSAVVISQHANSRDSNNIRANVLEVVPIDSSVEVVKQQGAWFYVKTETVSGWMHGNTLRLQSFESKPVTVSPSRLAPRPAPQPTVEESVDDSGATAKCRDGSLSYSAHRRGTCSHHGGVAIWY